MCVNLKRKYAIGRVVKNGNSTGFQRPTACSYQQLRLKKRLYYFCLKKKNKLRFTGKSKKQYRTNFVAQYLTGK